MKNILIIHTGGTISMLEDKDTGEVNTTDNHPLSNFTEYLLNYANIYEQTIFDLPSPQIRPNHMLLLGKKINKLIGKYDGVVVTHGTDTLEETAYFLDLMLETEKPVIVTGAMRSSNEIGSDALYNLISSVRVASDDNAMNKGVLVVMNDEIHTAEYVTKTSTSNVATFQSPQYGPIGIVTKESIIFNHTIISHTTFSIDTLSNHKVMLLKAFTGMDQSIIQAIHSINPDGVVIEALGQGNLPNETIPAIKQMLRDNIPIILVSRCYQGNVQPTYAYDGGGKQLKEMGVIFANGLSGQKARIKLLIALEKTKDYSKLKAIFEE
ncbi:asparaginase [Oceanobacillus chungangensis]|uniref:asparaginase n=1 Tax=Oceanobacillus chungangensis TaxID=1229152 RepID=A0A3D8Q2V7_9BACI|nr:asparaginase [Oceanobacillus chungangensis]RDW22028.1 L-asparaginase [Oceanobacillus chungangensis]